MTYDNMYCSKCKRRVYKINVYKVITNTAKVIKSDIFEPISKLESILYDIQPTKPYPHEKVKCPSCGSLKFVDDVIRTLRDIFAYYVGDKYDEVVKEYEQKKEV